MSVLAVRCPRCDAGNAEDATFCGQCQHRFVPSVPRYDQPKNLAGAATVAGDRPRSAGVPLKTRWEQWWGESRNIKRLGKRLRFVPVFVALLGLLLHQVNLGKVRLPHELDGLPRVDTPSAKRIMDNYERAWRENGVTAQIAVYVGDSRFLVVAALADDSRPLYSDLLATIAGEFKRDKLPRLDMLRMTVRGRAGVEFACAPVRGRMESVCAWSAPSTVGAVWARGWAPDVRRMSYKAFDALAD